MPFRPILGEILNLYESSSPGSGNNFALLNFKGIATSGADLGKPTFSFPLPGCGQPNTANQCLSEQRQPVVTLPGAIGRSLFVSVMYDV
jgi:hypothetical protein